MYELRYKYPTLTARIIASEKRKEEPSWGLFIYRTDFQDEDTWKQYIDYIRKAIIASLQPYTAPGDQLTIEHIEERDKLRKSPKIITREDPSLDGLSVQEVREIFQQWSASFFDREKSLDPKWNYFIYVDQHVLDLFKQKVAAREKWQHVKSGST
ncbi:hypothetical protein F5X99DRAFT_410335 [Biscogniauxia marginata]|nr:hypothetical protein F5X99DRAFT_410335 [Biscogniauxia marginata]